MYMYICTYIYACLYMHVYIEDGGYKSLCLAPFVNKLMYIPSYIDAR